MGKEKKSRKLSAYEVAVFCDQTAMLLNSGITLNEGMYMLCRDMEDRRTKAVLQQIHDMVDENKPLNEALTAVGVFPEYMIHMTAVGEETGRLDDVMKSLSLYYDRESRIRAEQRSAIAYPILLFSIMTVIIAILAWKILPMFEQMFIELGGDVASSTRNAMEIGLMAGKAIAVITGVFLLLVILALLYGRTAKGSAFMQRLSSGIGITRKAARMMAVGKFISSMSLMVSSGIDIADAMDKEAKSCENEHVAGCIARCLELYREGKNLDAALREAGLLAGLEAGVISVAIKAGSLDVALARLSEQYNEKISEALSKISTRIETVLVVALSVLVGAVLISVMLPLVSMISSIG